MEDGARDLSCTIDVKSKRMSSFTINYNRRKLLDDPMQMSFGASFQLAARVTNAGYAYDYCPINPSCLTWTSSDPSVCTVSADGVVTAGSKSGTATITATTKGGVSSSQNFEVVAPTATPEATVVPTVEPTATPEATVEPTAEPTVYLYGDVNANGVLEAADALMILRHVVKLADLGSDALVMEIADADHDGAITASDALTVLRGVVALTEPEYFSKALVPVREQGNGK